MRLSAFQSWVMPSLRPRIPFAAMRRRLSPAVRESARSVVRVCSFTRTLRTESVRRSVSRLCCAVPHDAANADVSSVSQLILSDDRALVKPCRRSLGVRSDLLNLDLDVDAGRQVEALERLDRLRRRLH